MKKRGGNLARHQRAKRGAVEFSSSRQDLHFAEQLARQVNMEKIQQQPMVSSLQSDQCLSQLQSQLQSYGSSEEPIAVMQIKKRTTLRSRGERVKQQQHQPVQAEEAVKQLKRTSKARQRRQNSKQPRQLGSASRSSRGSRSRVEEIKTAIAWLAWHEKKSQHEVAIGIAGELPRLKQRQQKTRRRSEDCQSGITPTTRPSRNSHRQLGSYMSTKQIRPSTQNLHSSRSQLSNKLQQRYNAHESCQELAFSQRIVNSLSQASIQQNVIIQNRVKQQSPLEHQCLRESTKLLKELRRKNNTLKQQPQRQQQQVPELKEDSTTSNIKVASSSSQGSLEYVQTRPGSQTQRTQEKRNIKNKTQNKPSSTIIIPRSQRRRQSDLGQPMTSRPAQLRSTLTPLKSSRPGSGSSCENIARLEKALSGIIGSTVNQFPTGGMPSQRDRKTRRVKKSLQETSTTGAKFRQLRLKTPQKQYKTTEQSYTHKEKENEKEKARAEVEESVKFEISPPDDEDEVIIYQSQSFMDKIASHQINRQIEAANHPVTVDEQVKKKTPTVSSINLLEQTQNNSSISFALQQQKQQSIRSIATVSSKRNQHETLEEEVLLSKQEEQSPLMQTDQTSLISTAKNQLKSLVVEHNVLEDQQSEEATGLPIFDCNKLMQAPVPEPEQEKVVETVLVTKDYTLNNNLETIDKIIVYGFPTERLEKSKNAKATVMLSSKIERKRSKSSRSKHSEKPIEKPSKKHQVPVPAVVDNDEFVRLLFEAIEEDTVEANAELNRFYQSSLFLTDHHISVDKLDDSLDSIRVEDEVLQIMPCYKKLNMIDFFQEKISNFSNLSSLSIASMGITEKSIALTDGEDDMVEFDTYEDDDPLTCDIIKEHIEHITELNTKVDEITAVQVPLRHATTHQSPRKNIFEFDKIFQIAEQVTESVSMAMHETKSNFYQPGSIRKLPEYSYQASQVIAADKQIKLEANLMQSWEIIKQRQKLRQTMQKPGFGFFGNRSKEGGSQSLHSNTLTNKGKELKESQSLLFSSTTEIMKTNKNQTQTTPIRQTANQLLETDTQLLLMEEMILRPVIDSKYLLTVREEAQIENVQPALFAHVVQQMEAYDLHEYELPTMTLVNQSVSLFSMNVEKFTVNLQGTFPSTFTLAADQDIKNLSPGSTSPIHEVENHLQEARLEEKIIKIDRIIPLLERLAKESIYEEFYLKNVLHQIVVGPYILSKQDCEENPQQDLLVQIRREFYLQIWDKPQKFTFRKLRSRLKEVERHREQQQRKSRSRGMLVSNSNVAHASHLMAHDSDFQQFAALQSGSDRIAYITSMHTYKMMRSLVNPQSLSTFLLSSNRRDKTNSLVSNLYDAELLALMDQHLRDARQCATTAAFTEQQQRDRKLKGKAMLDDVTSESSSDDDCFGFQRMKALLPDPTFVQDDSNDNNKTNKLIKGQNTQTMAVKCDQLQTSHGVFHIFPLMVKEWNKGQSLRLHKQKLLIESFSMHTVLHKLPYFEPLMEIFVPKQYQVTQTLQAGMRRPHTIQMDPKSKFKQATKHEIQFQPNSGTFMLKKIKSKKSLIQRAQTDIGLRSLTDKLDLDPEQQQLQADDSLETDDSLSQLTLHDIYDFYVMLDDQHQPEDKEEPEEVKVVQRDEGQNERFEILIKGFYTATMDYIDKAEINNANAGAADEDMMNPAMKPISDQTIAHEYKMQDALDEMVARFSKNQIKEFVGKQVLEAEVANKMEEVKEESHEPLEQKLEEKSESFQSSDQSSTTQELKSINMDFHPAYQDDQPLVKKDTKKLKKPLLQRKRSSSAYELRGATKPDIEVLRQGANKSKEADPMVNSATSNAPRKSIAEQNKPIGNFFQQQKANQQQVQGLQKGRTMFATGIKRQSSLALTQGQDNDMEYMAEKNRLLTHSSWSHSESTKEAEVARSLNSSHFNVEDNMSQSSDEIPIPQQPTSPSPVKDAIDDVSQIDQQTSSLKRAMTDFEELSIQKKKPRRVRLLRQDVFKPETEPIDTKKVIHLARKTSEPARRVLHRHNSLISGKSFKFEEYPKENEQPQSTLLKERHELNVLYDQQQLRNLISKGGTEMIITEAIQKFPISFNEPLDDMGLTWLILAVKNGRVDVAKRLCLQRDVDMNKPDRQGNTALHHAFLQRFENCIQLLVDCGADESLKNHQGLQPWELYDYDD